MNGAPCCSNGLLTPTSNLRLPACSGMLRPRPSSLSTELLLDDCLPPPNDQVAKLCGLRLGPGPYLASFLLGGGEDLPSSTVESCCDGLSVLPVRLGNSCPNNGDLWLRKGPVEADWPPHVVLGAKDDANVPLAGIALLAVGVTVDVATGTEDARFFASAVVVSLLMVLLGTSLLVAVPSSLLALQPPLAPCPLGTKLMVGSLPLCSAFKLGKLAGARLAVGTFPRDCNPCLVGILFCRGFKADPLREEELIKPHYNNNFVSYLVNIIDI